MPGKVGNDFRDVRTWKAVRITGMILNSGELINIQYAVNVVRSSRNSDTKTPFLNNISGEDGYLGRPLTDGELAEECMGGVSSPVVQITGGSSC